MKFELTKEFINDIKERLEQKDFKVLKSELSQLHHVDIAALIEELGEEQGKTLFELFEDQDSAEILIELDDENREVVLEDLTSQEIAEELIENLDSDDAADIISDLSTAKKVEVLSHIEDIEHASDIVDLLSYPENTAGGLMAKELIQVNDKWSVLRCVKEMRKQAEDVDKVYTIYVVNDHNILLGTLSLKKLLLTSEKTYIKNVYNEKVISVKADFDDEEVANIMDKYDLVVLPVVDDLNRLIGRITIDDIVDVIKEEAMEDYNKASGISEQVDSSDDIITLTRARLPWLLIGLMGGIMGAQVMGIFDIQNNIELAFFTPLIAAMAGNVGVQSSAIIVQGLANDDVKGSVNNRLLKEMFLAALNGVILAIFLFLFVWATKGEIQTALAISVSLVAVIIMAGLIGTFVPLFLDKRGIDPAIATGPFITTSNDILGILLYFWIARLILGI